MSTIETHTYIDKKWTESVPVAIDWFYDCLPLRMNTSDVKKKKDS